MLMPKEKLSPGFVKKKMLINGVKTDMIVPVNSLDRVKHLIIE